MIELDSLLLGINQVEGRDAAHCLELCGENGSYDGAYYTDHKTIPVTEMECKCMERICFLKPWQCKGDCSKNRPYTVIRFGSDIVDEFECNVEYSIVLGTDIYDVKRVLPLGLVFNPPCVLIYLDQPNMPKEIVFSSRRHYFKQELRRKIAQIGSPGPIIDGPVQYTYGFAGPSIRTLLPPFPAC